MIRVATQCLPVVTHPEDVYENADVDAVLALYSKFAVETAVDEVYGYRYMCMCVYVLYRYVYL